jgi:hydrogenase maturation protease
MTEEEQLRGGAGAPPRNVLLLGVGNILLGDDGFGVHLINSLADTPFPPNIQVQEAGTVSHQLIPLFRELDHLIIIDVVDAKDRPGSIFRFSPEDLQYTKEQMVSLHQVSLIDVLTMAELTGGRPKTTIIAVQPQDVTNWSLELTEPVKGAIPRVKELIMEELKKIGAL